MAYLDFRILMVLASERDRRTHAHTRTHTHSDIPHHLRKHWGLSPLQLPTPWQVSTVGRDSWYPWLQA